MPYPRAFYAMLALIGVLIVGFWPTYLGIPTTVPWQFHAHGIAASLWILTVTAQSWTAQRKTQLDLHRAIGKTSLLLFPFLTAGLAAIIDRQGKDYLAGDPVNLLDGRGFLLGTMVAMAAYVTVYYRALKYRRKVWAHAGYMLSTPLILFESPFSRVLTLYVPGFVVTGPGQFGRIMPSIEWSMAIELAIIAIIWWRVREKAAPFLVTAGFITVEMLAMGVANHVEALKLLDVAIGHAPSAAMWLIGLAIGAATSWAGWRAGKPQARPAPAAAQAA